jgi:ketosteroid isomerase-like protein
VSQENVDRLREGFAAFNREGVEAILELVAPDFEAETPPELSVEPDTYRGHAGVRRYFESFYEAMDKVEFQPERFVAVGELVVVPITLRARGRTTGIETEQRVVQVWELLGEKAIRVEVFPTVDEAIAAARESR